MLVVLSAPAYPLMPALRAPNSVSAVVSPARAGTASAFLAHNLHADRLDTA